MVICLEQGVNDLHMVWLMPLAIHHLFRAGLVLKLKLKPRFSVKTELKLKPKPRF